MLTCRADRLWEEIVFIAYYLHWSFDTIAGLDHPARLRVLAEVTRINAELNGGQRIPHFPI